MHLGIHMHIHMQLCVTMINGEKRGYKFEREQGQVYERVAKKERETI